MRIALVCLAGVLALAACSPEGAVRWPWGASSHEARETRNSPKPGRPPSFFYRMKADFVLKESGEPIRFDYVVGCGGVFMGNAGTSPTVFYEHHPMIMFQPVGNGHVLGLVTIDMCEDWKWGEVQVGPRRGESRIPEDLRPLAIWIEDINDLSFGWGYKTDDAYDSPLAKIEFVEASVTKTDEVAWRAWREKAKAGYEQLGALPGPWGYNYTHDPIDVRHQAFVRGKGDGIVGNTCPTQGRIQVEPEILAPIFELAGDSVGRYWVVTAERNASDALYRIDSLSSDGRSLKAYRSVDNWYLGTLSRGGGGHISPPGGNEHAGLVYHDVFPVLPRSRAMPGVTEPQDTYVRKILIEDTFKGFGFCYSGAKAIDSLLRPVRPGVAGRPNQAFDPDARSKNHRLLVGGELASGTDVYWRTANQNLVLDRDGAVYFGDQ